MTFQTVACYIVVGEPDLGVAQTCPDCGFDAMLKFPLTSISPNGVSSFGHYRACVRCADMAEDE